MCGVIGLVHERDRDDLGVVAGELLTTLEYRGYDSTGAAVQSSTSEAVTLRKDVGAPSAMIHELGIVDLSGQVLCGQVRWATFGAVDRDNAQPHEVRCHTHLYGAHNGNVTNCDALERWLVSEGHDVRSNNDGEMVVHVVEHLFAERLPAHADDPDGRRAAMREAIVEAGRRLEGSFAAVVVDPRTRTLWAIKAGSSLYFGVGESEAGGRFAIASSDLSSVLKLTRVLVAITEGEVIEFDATRFEVRSLRDGAVRPRAPHRSRLRAKDTALVPPFRTFMEQEIHAQEAACRDVLRIFGGGSDACLRIAPFFDHLAPDERAAIAAPLDTLLDRYADDAIAAGFRDLLRVPALRTLLGRAPASLREETAGATDDAIAERMHSAEAGFFVDLLAVARGEEERLAVRVLDALLEHQEVAEYADAIQRFCDGCLQTQARGGRVFLVSCGTSFHAAKAASLFFNALASTEVIPLLPGEFRGQYADNLRDGDMFVAISQSGETKDLIDVVGLVIASGRDIARVALVNNVSSTLAQEKSDLVIPLRCGPEIAVPATKSFVNQLTIFYCLAVRLAERRLTSGHEVPGQAHDDELARRNLGLPELPNLVRATIEATRDSVEEAAEHLYLAPSIHLLATRLLAVAKEGALKVREVVLNHTEGFEGSEFKHGPNTILGLNTVLGLEALGAVLDAVADAAAAQSAAACALGPDGPGRVLRAATARLLGRAGDDGSAEESAVVERVLAAVDLTAALRRDYPLVYITGPDPRDVALTVSQINTHKIRGASTVVVAEDDPRLREAADKPPAGANGYRSIYVALPPTGDPLMTVFSATVALQRLALAMSLRKMAHLDRLGIRDHGVHPDVPKNVSKSITVD